MGVIVQFDFNAWVATYPEFSNINETTAKQYFAIATVYHRNDGIGPVNDSTVQSVLLNMVTAFIAARYAKPDGSPAASNSLVGRLSDVSQGSVSASAEGAATVSGSQAFWMQNKYGADYWNATEPYRKFRYSPPRGWGVGGLNSGALTPRRW